MDAATDLATAMAAAAAEATFAEYLLSLQVLKRLFCLFLFYIRLFFFTCQTVKMSL